MDGSNLTTFLACVAIGGTAEVDLRSRLQAPLAVSPLPPDGASLSPPAPLHVYVGADPGAVLTAGLQLTDKAPHQGGLVVALHIAPDLPALAEEHARDAIRLALSAKSACFLVSAAGARRLAGALPEGYQLRSLGRQRRRDLAPPEELFALCPTGANPVLPELKVLPDGPTPLPTQHTPFVGRQRELAALGAALLEHRLVTVTGPLGAGKSRLAMQVAAALSDEFHDGIGYRDLSQGALPRDAARVEALQGCRLLLLDNVNPLAEGLSEVVRTLLGANPTLRILCTSLAPLGLQSEYRFPLSPLSLSPAAGTGQSEAVQLFLTRTATASPYIMTDDLGLTDQLCRTLGGLPLAIERATELVPVVPLAQLVQRLRTDLTLLATQQADVPARHRSMRDALAQNCNLLSPEARDLLSRLSVFQDRFTLAAAEAVCPDAALTAEQLLPRLCELTHASLLQVEQHQGTTLYSLLPTTRLYGRSGPDAPGQSAAIRTRHRDWFLSFAEQVSRSKDRTRWNQVDLCYLDLEGALHLALEAGDGATAQRFCTALSGYWSSRGKLQAGFKLLQQALALPCDSAVHHTNALNAAGCMAGDLGELTMGESLLRQAIASWREVPDITELARTLMNLGVALRRQGRYDEAEAVYRESLAIQTTLPDQSDLVLTYLNLGVVLGTRGDQLQAAQQFQAALDTARRIGDQWGAATALSQLARAAIIDKRLDDAMTYQSEALVIFRGLGDQLGMAVTLSSLASVSRDLGNLDQALAYFRECITIALKMRRLTTLLDNMDQLLQVLLALDHLEVVARLLGFCDHARQRESTPRSPQLAAQVQKVTEESTKTLGGTWFGALYRAGSLMTLEQAVEVATSVATPILPKAAVHEPLTPDRPAIEGTDGLSAREVQIIQLLVQGLSSRELGEQLYLSPRTVEKHLERLRQRLGVPNKARLISWALQNGFGKAPK